MAQHTCGKRSKGSRRHNSSRCISSKSVFDLDDTTQSYLCTPDDDVAHSTLELALQAHNSYILKCLLSPDCRMLATTSSDKTIKLFNLDSFTLERTLVGHQRWVWDAVFSVDAAYLVTASSDATSRLWDLSTVGC